MSVSVRIWGWFLAAVLVLASCGSEEESSNGQDAGTSPMDSGNATDADTTDADAASPDADAATSDADATDADTTDATTDPVCGERWPDVSDECWSCLCTTCPEETGVCGAACGAVTQCAYDQGCLGDHGVLEETLCLFTNCQAELDAAPTVGTWDQCLLQGQTFPRRSCDEACGLYPYPTAE